MDEEIKMTEKEFQQNMSDDVSDFRQVVKDRLYSENALTEIQAWIQNKIACKYYPIINYDAGVAVARFYEAIEKECENLLKLSAGLYAANIFKDRKIYLNNN